VPEHQNPFSKDKVLNSNSDVYPRTANMNQNMLLTPIHNHPLWNVISAATDIKKTDKNSH